MAWCDDDENEIALSRLPVPGDGHQSCGALVLLVPRKIVTDQLRSYRAAKADIAALHNVKHVFVKAAARVNNRAENSHQPTRQRERRM